MKSDGGQKRKKRAIDVRFSKLSRVARSGVFLPNGESVQSKLEHDPVLKIVLLLHPPHLGVGSAEINGFSSVATPHERGSRVRIWRFVALETAKDRGVWTAFTI